MKFEEHVKAVRYVREDIDLVVTDEGFVILPAWQFALFVKAYENHRHNNIMWLGVLGFLAVWFLFYITTLS